MLPESVPTGLAVLLAVVPVTVVEVIRWLRARAEDRRAEKGAMVTRERDAVAELSGRVRELLLKLPWETDPDVLYADLSNIYRVSDERLDDLPRSLRYVGLIIFNLVVANKSWREIRDKGVHFTSNAKSGFAAQLGEALVDIYSELTEWRTGGREKVSKEVMDKAFSLQEYVEDYLGDRDDDVYEKLAAFRAKKESLRRPDGSLSQESNTELAKDFADLIVSLKSPAVRETVIHEIRMMADAEKNRTEAQSESTKEPRD